MGLEDHVRPDDAKLGRLRDRHRLRVRLDVAIEGRCAERGLALDVLHPAAIRPLEEQTHEDELATAPSDCARVPTQAPNRRGNEFHARALMRDG